MATNKNMNKAKDEQNDEYYTRLVDIENELKHYRSHLSGKVIYCNCDDPEWSNFWNYFKLNFEFLGIKKLVATHYDKVESTYKLEYDGIDTVQTPLVGNGDFRNQECIDLLQEADIVITNPPFSLFRDYMAQLIEYNKSFLIIGPSTAIHYKEIFPLLKENKVWIGYKSMTSDMLFNVSDEFAEWLVQNKKKGSGYKIIDGEIKGRSQCIWYTNLDITKRHEEFIAFKPYDPAIYPTYSNFDGIDVKSVNDIPIDYDGYMGVPDSFMDVYNPEQYELCGMSTGDTAKQIGVQKNYRGRTDLAFKDPVTGKDKCPFSRIIIRRK